MRGEILFCWDMSCYHCWVNGRKRTRDKIKTSKQIVVNLLRLRARGYHYTCMYVLYIYMLCKILFQVISNTIIFFRVQSFKFWDSTVSFTISFIIWQGLVFTILILNSLEKTCTNQEIKIDRWKYFENNL